MDYKYNRDLYIKPVYEGEIAYFETALFVGKDEEKSLLFPIKKIISVRNFGLDKEYIENKDYIFKDGKLYLTENTSIPYFEVDEYYIDKPEDPVIQIGVVNERCKRKFTTQKYLKYREKDFFTSRQIAVTYVHDDSWKDYVPTYQGNKVSRFIKKLENKKPATILFYGDSITTGCNASGVETGGIVKPYCEMWPVMVTKYLEDKYQTKINYVNTAVGGMNTIWGVDNVKERVVKYKPDLVVIAFGMNDPCLSNDAFKSQIMSMVNAIEADNPNVEFLLIATTVPNTESNWYGNQCKYIEALKEINKDNVAIVDMTSMHLALLKYKSFKDMTGNNINHPNDYLVRVYASSIIKTILK